MRIVFAFLAFVFAVDAVAQTPPLIRMGRGFAAEEQLWLMSVRKDLTPNQGKRYELGDPGADGRRNGTRNMRRGNVS